MDGGSDRSFEFERFRRLGAQTDVWALSSESSITRDIYAAAASWGRSDFEALREDVDAGDLAGWDVGWVARLSRVLALQPGDSDQQNFAFKALKLAVHGYPEFRLGISLRKLLFELHFIREEYAEARSLLESDGELASLYHGYLRADLLNPFHTQLNRDIREWLDWFNNPMIAAGVSPVNVASDSYTPFDGLFASCGSPVHDGPKVSVILTTFNPDANEIRTAVKSILEQSWSNIELLLIDDCSDASFIPPLEEIASADSRVHLIRASVNGGTYRARNIGIREATGKYITGQDTDDWSHPDRLRRQVEFLEGNPEVPGVTVAANRTDENLVRVALGHNPERRCEVSLMTRRDTALAVGGYLPMRKAADSEFRERLEICAGSPTGWLDEPLYMIRMSNGSLSRADFRPGWSHHARRAFWSAYKQWHRNASVSNLRSGADQTDVSIARMAPERIAGKEWSHAREFDICVVADWRGSMPVQRSAMDELTALVESNLRVAILQFDTPWGNTSDFRGLDPGVQCLINSGKIQRVFSDESVDVDLMLIRDPACVDYAKATSSEINAKAVLMIGYGQPARNEKHLWLYNASHADKMAKEVFGRVPVWTAPAGEEVAVLHDRWNLRVQTVPYPIYIDTASFTGPRLVRKGSRPVIGRTAENETEQWPARGQIFDAYPDDGTFDVRVFGDARGAIRASGRRHLPIDWMQYRPGEVNADVFWRTLDAVVLFDRRYPGSGVERPVLEALTTGLPVVTDFVRSKVYGDAVVPSEPGDAIQSTLKLLNDTDKLRALRSAGKEFVSNYTNASILIDYVEIQLRLVRTGARPYV